jgi:hypothetical protein
MERLEWTRGKSGPPLARLWGVAEATVRDYAAEASRRITADETEARRDISVGCRELFVRAVQDVNFSGAKAVGELWASVSGAKATERHQVSVNNEATPAEAARLIREKFGGHAMKGEDDAARDTESEDSSEVSADPSG